MGYRCIVVTGMLAAPKIAMDHPDALPPEARSAGRQPIQEFGHSVGRNKLNLAEKPLGSRGRGIDKGDSIDSIGKYRPHFLGAP